MKNFSTLLLFGLIVVNVFIVKFVFIDDNSLKFDFTAQHDIVNYSDSEILNVKDVDLEIVEQKYNSMEFPFVRKEKQNVCVIDGFTLTESEKYSHGEKVTYFINKYYDGDVKQYDFLDVSYQSYAFNKCDIINYSLVIKEFNRNKDLFEKIEKFMSKYDGIMVVSSGNVGNTITQSEWSSYKKSNPNKEWLNRLIIVGQGRILETVGPSGYQSLLEIESSFGEEVDVFVPNFLENLDGEYLTGSSFAAPIITSMIANALSVGVNIENVKEVVIPYNELLTTDDYQKENVFNMENSVSNIEKYLIENDISFIKK